MVVEISATLFQPARSGSHLIYRNPYTPCGRGLYRQGLTRLSWGLPLRFCLASLICTCIIAHIWLLVKYFFEKSQFYFLGFRLHLLLSRSVLLAKSLVEELGNTPWNRTFAETSFRTPFVPLLYHNLSDLSRGFLHFFSKSGASVDLLPSGLPFTLSP